MTRGNPALAADPKSLAGKLLRIDTTGKPAKGNPDPSTAVIASGFHAPGGICIGADARPWVTDRGPQRDAIYHVERASRSATRVDVAGQTSVAGCVVTPAVLMVAASTAGNMQNLPLNPEGVITAKPTVSLQDKEGFGRLGGMAVLNPNYALAGTVNKSGGTPVSSDDRVVLISTTAANAGTGGKD
ncbi:hypothetical protein [Kibdelosporangium philippinense]|uniref:hypothetical protein n=1 Tax=Kibdelosporangium philippinense TaxID=211113 RepID=UPI00361BBBD3